MHVMEDFVVDHHEAHPTQGCSSHSEQLQEQLLTFYLMALVFRSMSGRVGLPCAGRQGDRAAATMADV
jgi:hypothetical protein